MIIVFILLLVILGCTLPITMYVSTYRDPGRDLLQGSSFSLVLLNESEQLVEKNLLHQAKEKLINKGYIYDEKSPDFIVTTSFYFGPFESYIPQRTFYVPEYVPGQTSYYSGSFDGSYYYGTATSSGYTRQRPVTTGGYTVIQHYRELNLFFVDYDILVNHERVELLWQGKVHSTGSSSDYQHISKIMVNELMDEFPVRSGKPHERRISQKRTQFWMTN